MANNKSIYLFAALTSILLSTWVAWREVIINPDAICYLQSAAVVGAGGLRKAMNLCGQAQWPLYSVLIYFLSYFTHLTLMTSAYVLDALFSVISVITFISIIRQLGGSKRVLWLAAVTILLAHEFNSIRQYIVRDHGYWAFYLLSISLLLQYFTTCRWYYAFFWGVSLLLATLFRVEGTVFLVLLPWCIWYHSTLTFWQKVKGFLQLNIIPLTIGMAVFGWLIFHPEISLASLGRMQEFVFQLFHAGGVVWQRFQASADAFAHSALTSDSWVEANLVFLLAVLMWYVVKVVTNLSLVYSGLVAYGVSRKTFSLSRAASVVVVGYLVVNILITCIFLFEHLFLSKRYLIALSLILMLAVPFALDRLIVEWKMPKHRQWVMPVVFLLVIASSLGGIFDFGYSKLYMRNAGDWLAENVPANATLYCNDYQIMYYSQHFGNDIFQKVKEYSEVKVLTNSRWKAYNYVALRVSKKTEGDVLHAIKQEPVRIFENSRGDQIRIYKIN